MIVLWRVTERCNYACGFCAYDRSLKGARRDVDGADVMRLGAILSRYGRERGERVLISWLGGEPLLWAPVFGASKTLRSEGLAVSLTTNGSTLHRPDVRAQLADFDEVTVSVDADAQLHDHMRGFAGAWARCRDGIIALRRARDLAGHGPMLRANVVLMRTTLPGFAALAHDLAAWGIDEITFNQLGGRDRPEFFPAERLHPCDIAALRARLPDLSDELAAKSVRLCAAPAYLDRFAATAAGEAWPVTECGMGERHLFIDEAGRVSPCSFTSADFSRPIDAVRSVQDLIDLPGQFRATRSAKPAAVCADCPSTQVFAKFAS